MKSIHIRQIDEKTLNGLKRRAKLHRRSLQKEIEALLEDAARMMPAVEAEQSVANGLHMVSGGRSHSQWTREAIYGVDGR